MIGNTRNYIIYWDGYQVGTFYGETPSQAIENFVEEHQVYQGWNLTAFEIDIP